ncbi:septum site-determining protein MinC [Acetobacter sp. AN02]|uniref:septum site-determining protein MinC n=1 Tax=Acetobacter sp. AN02 TaxID=2894186 RepID=UPI0024346070|nr:septum site-determining protein MinC [Acetobacter sp. AN02]MDG6094544.1 septum site-determining protein MinC [Acetobacter sp. AN02]
MPRIRAGGRSFLALVLTPEAPLDQWMAALDVQIVRSAGFFSGKPVILDLSLVTEETAHLAEFGPALKERGIRVIGIEGADPEWAVFSGWEWPEGFAGGRSSPATPVPDDEHGDTAEPETPPGSLILEEGLRSGQSIVYAEGDVIVLGGISSGAEVSAGGSIHVYGPLRGRAIAGIVGRPDARIFARVMEPELLAIDGYYAITEELDPKIVGKPGQAVLVDDCLIIRPLT